MSRLFKFELYKLFHKKSFYFCIALTVLVMVGLLIGEHIVGGSIESDLSKFLTGVLPNSLIAVTMAVFSTLYVTQDFSNSTMKNIIARGHSRSNVFFAKYLVSTIAVVIMAFVLLVSSAITGIALGASGSISMVVIYTLITQIVILIAENTIYFAASMYVRSSGLSLAFAFLVPMVITALIAVLSISFRNLPFNLSDFWVKGLDAKLVGTQTFMKATKFLAVAAAYIAVFVSVGNVLFKQKDY